MVRNVVFAVAGYTHERTLRPIRSWLHRQLVDDAASSSTSAFEAFASSSDPGASSRSRSGMRASSSASSSSSPAFPGPMSFVTSSFFVALLGLSILLNRIHHLVPPRRPFADRDPLPDGSNAPLPTKLRLVLRLPSLILLLRSLTLLSALLLAHNCDSNPFSSTSYGRAFVRCLSFLTPWACRSELGRLVQAADGSRLPYAVANASTVMWEVFVAVALAVVTETFVRALADDLGSQASFNLLSFSFLLHLHSAPFYASPPTGQAWHPPTHLYIHLLLTLLELFVLHTSSIWTPPRRSLRLAITAFFSLIGQIILSVGFYRAVYAPQGRRGPALLDDSITWEGTVWMSLIPDLTFEALALMTIVLRASAIMLRREDMTMEGVFGHRAHWPKRSDDWGVGMIKYATACLESSTLAGLANEVSPIRIMAPLPLSLLSLQLPDAPAPPTSDTVQLGRSSSSSSGHVYRLPPSQKSPRQSPGEGFANEIKSIEILRREGEEVGGIGGGEQRRKAWRGLWGLAWKMSFFVVWKTYRASRRVYLGVIDFLGCGVEEDREADAMERWVSRGSGEEIEDAEDGDYVPSEEDEDGGNSSEDDDSNLGSDVEVKQEEDASWVDDDEDGEDGEAASLLQELFGSSSARRSRRHRSSSASPSSSSALAWNRDDRQSADLDEVDDRAALAPLLLAHYFTPSGTSPMTRRRYASLSSPNPAPPQAFSSAIEQRRLELPPTSNPMPTLSTSSDDPPYQKLCVICATDERSIICWPCRCLTMCDGCRDHLSTRTSAREHLCPTCRGKLFVTVASSQIPPSLAPWFASTYSPTFRFDPEWLDACVEYLVEHFPDCSTKPATLIKKVEEQLLASDLATSTLAPSLDACALFLPPPNTHPQRSLFPHKKLVQIISVDEVAYPALGLLETLKDQRARREAGEDLVQPDLGGASNDVTADPDEAVARSWPRGLVKLGLSDGYTMVQAFEKTLVRGLGLGEVKLGCKLLLHNISYTSKLLLLTPETVTIKGSQVPELEQFAERQLERTLQRRLGLDIPPDPDLDALEPPSNITDRPLPQTTEDDAHSLTDATATEGEDSLFIDEAAWEEAERRAVEAASASLPLSARRREVGVEVMEDR
ncbi:BQ2448_8055 [Microbotryum intermedium]|uniref:RecQ-mediated genome instability protein 1 n=1 Tax=Microbotryum intermedium TaxID=269621 RepID=A0A238FTK1_9BASI|nr:BQ2448_8055 [Microbotryum intermedium]